MPLISICFKRNSKGPKGFGREDFDIARGSKPTGNQAWDG